MKAMTSITAITPNNSFTPGAAPYTAILVSHATDRVAMVSLGAKDGTQLALIPLATGVVHAVEYWGVRSTGTTAATVHGGVLKPV